MVDPITVGAVVAAQCVAPTLAGTVIDYLKEQVGSLPFGVLGNEIHAQLRQRLPDLYGYFTRSRVPANNELSIAARVALRNALISFSQGLAARVAPSEPLFQAARQFLRSGTRFEPVEANWTREAHGRWIVALQRLVLDDRKLDELEGHELGPAAATRLLQTVADSSAADGLADRVRDWLDTHLGDVPGRPAAVDELLKAGWPMGSDAEARVTLYDAWCQHFRAQIKSDPQALTRLVATQLSDLVPALLTPKLTERDIGSWLLDRTTPMIEALNRIESKLDSTLDGIDRIGDRLQIAQTTAKVQHDEVIALLVKAIEDRGKVGAGDGQAELELVLALARRLNPAVLDNFDQAIKELTFAVDIAVDHAGRTSRRDGRDGFPMDGEQLHIDELISKGRLDDAARETVRYLEDCSRNEELLRQRARKALQTCIDIEILRQDAKSAAQAIIRLSKMEGGVDAADALLAQQYEYYEQEGDLKGSNIASEIAIALARFRLTQAQGACAVSGRWHDLGNSLATLGDRQASNSHLQEAVAAFRESLQQLPRHFCSTAWGSSQNSLGNALRLLGIRARGNDLLIEAATAFRAALEVWKLEKEPQLWAMAQGNLGNSLLALGERESGPARLDEAVGSFRRALQVYSRESSPLDWAMTQNSLGIALLRLGDRGRDVDRLQEAVTTFRGVLSEWSRTRVPLKWAMAQNNLGNALIALGQIGTDTSLLREAVDVHRAALLERCRERAPFAWAESKHNLGYALMMLGEHEPGTALLEEAVAAFGEAQQEWTKERSPQYWQYSSDDMARANDLLEARRAI